MRMRMVWSTGMISRFQSELVLMPEDNDQDGEAGRKLSWPKVSIPRSRGSPEACWLMLMAFVSRSFLKDFLGRARSRIL